MASKRSSLALFLVLNLLFFTLFASACNTGCPTTKHKSKPKPSPKPTPKKGICPNNPLKLKVCANVLGGLLNINISKAPKKPCCSLIKGLVDVDAAACVCTAIKANVLGINLDVPLCLRLLLNQCGYKVPRGYKCA